MLPRPEGEYDVTAIIDRASEEVQEASDWAFGDSSGKGEGEKSGEADEDATEGAATDPNKKGKPGGKEGERTAQAENAKDGENGKQKGGEKSGEQQGEGEKQANNSEPGENSGKPQENGGEQQNQKPGENVAQNENKTQKPNENKKPQEPGEKGQTPDSDRDGEKVAQNSGEGEGEPPRDGESESEADSSRPETPESPDLSSVFSKVGDLFKWIVYGLIAAVAIFLIIRNWAAISRFLLNLWHELLSIFGRRPGATAEASVAAQDTAAPPQPFSAYSNPFQTGAARKKSPSELVRYTFEALQAWATENNCPREPNQTPIEFGQQLRAYKVPCAAEGQEVSQLYAEIAYASHRPGAESLPVLEKLWRKMSV